MEGRLREGILGFRWCLRKREEAKEDGQEALMKAAPIHAS